MGVKVSFLAEPAARPETAAAARRLLVPQAAIRTEGDRSIVFVLRGEAVERRAVTTGAPEGDMVTVLSGLTDGERVVVDGPAALNDGARVTVRER
jgi:multidrug efflux pump subunit AcrA (membrane-fusion protein)